MRASNYRSGAYYGYKHLVGPYYALTPDDGMTLAAFWHTVVDDVLAIIREHNAVMIGNPADFDDINDLVFIDIASDSEEDLVAILKELSEQGWSTGI